MGLSDWCQRLSQEERDFPVNVVVLGHHMKVLLGRDLRFGGHLKGSIAWRAAPGFLPSGAEIEPFDSFRAGKTALTL